MCDRCRWRPVIFRDEVVFFSPQGPISRVWRIKESIRVMLNVFLSFVAFSCLIALFEWRWGIYLSFVTAILQDPIRKVVPGTPAFLTAMSTIIFLAAFLGMLNARQINPFNALRLALPGIDLPLFGFLTCLLISFFQTVTSRVVPITAGALGFVSYFGIFPAIIVGHQFIRRDFKEFDRLLAFFVFATALALIGVQLELWNFKFADPWLGTITMKGAQWRRWYTPTLWVKMLCGFHRSPEIMGWHAMFMAVVSFYLLLRRNTRQAPIWMTTAGWGIYCVFLSSRRKMYVMMLVFIVTMLLQTRGWRRNRIISTLVLLLAIVALAFAIVIDDGYIAAAQSSFDVAGEKAAAKGLMGPLWLLQVVGPFGFGVGTKTQGAQHFGADDISLSERHIPLVEGGLEKILVELGYLGMLAGLVMRDIHGAISRTSSDALARRQPD